MNTIVIYGAYAEGFIFKGSTQLKAVEPCSSVYDVKGVTYIHFKAMNVFNGVLVREA